YVFLRICIVKKINRRKMTMKEYRSINKITRLSGHPKWKDEITNYIKKSYSRIADKIERE
ncbi:hypothetical protein ABWK43_10405, partial [Bacillus thuringiensis]